MILPSLITAALAISTSMINAEPLGLASPRRLNNQKRAVELTADKIDKIRDLAYSMNTLSWENGTLAQAIIEFDYPAFSPFNTSHASPLTTSSLQSSVPEPIINLARITLQNRPTDQNANTLNNPFQGGRLLEDGSSADPASLGIAVMLAGASEQVGGDVVGGVNYSTAATEEVQYQLYNVPRSSSGAISHRAETAQLWADFVYMVPPFLAYYGFATSNQTLLQIAYDQCRLYREGLQDQDTKLWRHIVGGEGNGISDNGLWATGNAWATAGMLRVAATIRRSEFSDSMNDQVENLGDWVEEIIVAAKSRTTSSGLVRNYMTTQSSFIDTAASSLLAYSAFRLSTMGFTNDHVGFANQIHSTVVGSHIAENGTLTEAVDPLVWDRQGYNGSPEGQSFVLLMQAAYGDYRAGGGEDNTSSEQEKGGAIALGRSWVGLVLAGSIVIATVFA